MMRDNKFKLPCWERVTFTDICYERDSPEFKRIINACLPGREETIQTLIQLRDVVGFHGLDLLQKMLDPSTTS
mgnify:FL=1